MIQKVLTGEAEHHFDAAWIDTVARGFTDDERQRLSQAIEWGNRFLPDKYMFTGEPSIRHAKGVMHSLSLLELDVDSMIAAILTALPSTEGGDGEEERQLKQDILERFGLEVLNLVQGTRTLIRVGAQATLIGVGQKAQESTDQQEMLRKMLLALATDLRIVILRLASRLQTLRWYTESKRHCPVILAQQTRDIYAPLANRLGIWQIKWELEDLALRFLEPAIYRDIANRLEVRRTEREALVADFIEQLQSNLAQLQIEAEVSGRAKHIYSIYNKMKNKHLPFEQIYDLHAIRVITSTERDCYTALSMVHSLWSPVMDEFDDYIARPKPNGYRSLHTVVTDEQGRNFEVQIRTHEMHKYAEYGMAAHWRYKESGAKGGQTSASSLYDRQISWMRQLLAWRREEGFSEHDAEAIQATVYRPETSFGEGSDASEVSQGELIAPEEGLILPSDMAAEASVSQEDVAQAQTTAKAQGEAKAQSKAQSKVKDSAATQPKSKSSSPPAPEKAPEPPIYVLTPQAKVLELPAGSTPVDFAYRLHTDLGHRCRGAKVDGQLVALNTPLKTGQTVEIIAAKSGGPSRDWLNPQLGYLASSRARAKVRLWFNAIELQKRIVTGQDLVEKELQRLGKTAVNLEQLAHKLGFSQAEDLYVAVAKEEFSLRNIGQYFDAPAQLNPDEAVLAREHQARGAKQSKHGVLVVGVDSLLTQLAGCCHPAPPDPVAGFITRGRGVSIHRQGCSSLKALAQRHPERIVEVEWGDTESRIYPVKLQVLANDRQGLLHDITELFSKHKINLVAVNTQARQGQARLDFTVEVGDGDQLGRAMASIREIPDVNAVHRQ